MDIRNDLYGINQNPEAQRYLLAFAYRTQEAFPKAFPTVEDVVKYVNNFKEPKIAELFLDIGDYYHSANFYTCPKCFPPKRIETCPHCKQPLELPSFIVLIMFISIMEKLSSVHSAGFEMWTDFFDWVSRKSIRKEYEKVLKEGKFNFKLLMDDLIKRYNLKFGSLTKVTSFLCNLMNEQEKIALIKSIKYMQKVPDLPPFKMPQMEPNTSFEDMEKKIQELHAQSESITFQNEEDLRTYVIQNSSKMVWEALPICYDNAEYWDCYAIDYGGHGNGYCHFKNDCALLSDKEKLDKNFRNTVKTIYDWRSKFVHDAQLPPVKETAIYGTHYKNKYAIIELTTTDFKPIFERIVKRFFDKFQS